MKIDINPFKNVNNFCPEFVNVKVSYITCAEIFFIPQILSVGEN